MKLIQLTQGYVALVDDQDYERVMAAGPWHARFQGNAVYAIRKIKGKQVWLHRFILGITDPSQAVDHVNRYGMDNRRANLRLCSRSQNISNSRKIANASSKYRGVTWKKQTQKWCARLTQGKTIHLGYFSDEVEAARAYDDAAREHFGEFANCNFKLKG